MQMLSMMSDFNENRMLASCQPADINCCPSIDCSPNNKRPTIRQRTSYEQHDVINDNFDCDEVSV